MRHLSRLLLPLSCLPLLASCVFLLDYDKLEGNAPTASGGETGAGGAESGGHAGSSGQAGNAGNPSGCGNCDDADPCTVDSCEEDGECAHTLEPGLALDGIDETIEAEAYFRVSLVAGSQLFYLSALSADQDVADVTLYRLGGEAAELETLERVSDLRLEGTVLSNVGLALDPAVGGLALHGFIAIQPKLAGSEPKVFHLVNHNDKTTSTAIAASSYRADNPLSFPQALTIGSKVVGAWIEADGTIAIHDVGGGTTTKLGDATLPAATLSLLSTANDEPAVFFGAQDETGTLGAYVETAGAERAALMECQTDPGAYVSTSAIPTQLPGVWLGQLTRAGEGYLTTRGSPLVCGNNGCAALPEKCEGADLANGVRNLNGATFHFQTDPVGLVYSVIAVPQVALGEDGKTVEARLTLSLAKVDFSEQGKADSMDIGTPFEAARMPTGEELGFAGPDWPAVGILPSRRVAVAWTEPNLDGSGYALRVQRYRMCLPEE